MTKIQATTMERILQERARQEQKWGEQNHNDYYWLGILAEEFGEAAKALIDEALMSGTPFRDVQTRPANPVMVHQIFQRPDTSSLEKELVQVAAVAIAWLEAIERRKAQ